jgi:hypothetical protein
VFQKVLWINCAKRQSRSRSLAVESDLEPMSDTLQCADRVLEGIKYLRIRNAELLVALQIALWAIDGDLSEEGLNEVKGALKAVLRQSGKKRNEDQDGRHATDERRIAEAALEKLCALALKIENL